MGAPKQKAIFTQVEISKTILKLTHGESDLLVSFEITQILTEGEPNLRRDHMKY